MAQMKGPPQPLKVNAPCRDYRLQPSMPLPGGWAACLADDRREGEVLFPKLLEVNDNRPVLLQIR